MKRLSLEGLAEILAKNPHIRIAGPKMPSEAFGIPSKAIHPLSPEKPVPQTRKYRNEPVVVDGIRYDSKKEVRRGLELKLLERAGQIKHLERQVRISLDINGVHICKYVADFKYQEKQKDGTWRIIVEDVKGVRTRLYIIKKNLVRALMGIEIRET